MSAKKYSDSKIKNGSLAIINANLTMNHIIPECSKRPFHQNVVSTTSSQKLYRMNTITRHRLMILTFPNY